jgi:hypothetical protein
MIEGWQRTEMAEWLHARLPPSTTQAALVGALRGGSQGRRRKAPQPLIAGSG